MTYEEAIKEAERISREMKCGQHVSARIICPGSGSPMAQGLKEPILNPVGYHVSDWYDDATVASFSNGRKVA